jgi:hypothetical protein
MERHIGQRTKHLGFGGKPKDLNKPSHDSIQALNESFVLVNQWCGWLDKKDGGKTHL